jgi:hypothetical protein
MSIKEFIEKSKCFPHKNKDIFIAVILVLVAFGSFGLGRLSKIEDSKTPITIQNMKASVVGSIVDTKIAKSKKTLPTTSQGGGFYIASKTGSKYHFPWCSGAKRIKDGNKIIFNTLEEARKAGYTPAGNCKGLK